MWKTFAILLLAAAAFSADDPWAKVSRLNSGSELRIFQSGQKKPLTAILDEVKAESLIIVVKKEQKAIPKDRIERIDWRPTGNRVELGARRVIGTKEDATTGKTTDGLPPRSTAGTLQIRSKGGFETVYRRSAP